MTITEAEIRTALDRAVQQADLAAEVDALPQAGPPSPSDHRRTRLLLAAAAVVALVAGLALTIRDGSTEQVRTDPQGTADQPAQPETTEQATTSAASSVTAPPSETTTSNIAGVTDTTAVDGTVDDTAVATTAAGTPTVTAPPPSEVRVSALNASGTSGVAGVLLEQLRGLGYQTAPVGNSGVPREESSIYFAPGFDAAALDLGTRLGIALIAPLPDESVAASTLGTDDADLYVVIGSDGASVSG